MRLPYARDLSERREKNTTRRKGKKGSSQQTFSKGAEARGR